MRNRLITTFGDADLNTTHTASSNFEHLQTSSARWAASTEIFDPLEQKQRCGVTGFQGLVHHYVMYFLHCIRGSTTHLQLRHHPVAPHTQGSSLSAPTLVLTLPQGTVYRLNRHVWPQALSFPPRNFVQFPWTSMYWFRSKTSTIRHHTFTHARFSSIKRFVNTDWDRHNHKPMISDRDCRNNATTWSDFS